MWNIKPCLGRQGSLVGTEAGTSRLLIGNCVTDPAAGTCAAGGVQPPTVKFHPTLGGQEQQGPEHTDTIGVEVGGGGIAPRSTSFEIQPVQGILPAIEKTPRAAVVSGSFSR